MCSVAFGGCHIIELGVLLIGSMAGPALLLVPVADAVSPAQSSGLSLLSMHRAGRSHSPPGTLLWGGL